MDLMNRFNESASDSNSKLPSSKYKGVVPQPNGRWGAQIYEKHQRVWLGTFNGEEAAAKAYDIASLRFRGVDAITNFKQSALSTSLDDYHDETLFLQSHSKAEIVDMLRKHSYANELELFKHNNGGERIRCHMNVREVHIQKEWLFEKVLTPSDVGRLNRFVIPKQQAERHFPLMDSELKGMLLNFEDDLGNVWRFRYCYWSSSQSYVLTKGWTRFMKEKKVEAGDVVRFYGSRTLDQDKKLFIDCRPRNIAGEASGFPGMHSPVDEPLMTPVQDHDGVVRLFGVNIVETCSSCVLGLLS